MKISISHPVQLLVVAAVSVLVTTITITLVSAQDGDEPHLTLNHIGIRVADLDEALTYYTETIGLREAFRVADDSGKVRLVYLWLGDRTFLELNPASEGQPLGLSHFGVQVDNMQLATDTFRRRGADVSDPRVSNATKAILSVVTDPNGVTMELLELPPNSTQQQVMRR